ncbi:MAG: hypothetical protein ACRYHQ_22825 [Janthinobacterium lividum]
MRNAVTPGWLGFWELRTKPQGNYEPRRHGNTRHGRYAKGYLTWRQVRATPPAPLPLGWRRYASLRQPDDGRAGVSEPLRAQVREGRTDE